MKQKSLNLDLKSSLKSLKKYGALAQKYQMIIFITSSVAVYGYLVMQISNAAQKEPTQSQIDEKTAGSQKLKIDQNSVSKIEQLEDQNVIVQSLFETARNNPFEEQ